MPFTNYHLERENNLEKELWGRCYVERAASMCYYRRGSRVQRLIHRLKYYGIRDIGIFLGEYYGHILNNSGFTDKIDHIIPVPLHPSKIRRRGFNQSYLISTGLSAVTGIDIVSNVLHRSLKSATQTRKSRVERWENVEGIFETSNVDIIENSHLLLVDDVITTGSTVEACVLALKKIEGVRVSVAAIATAVQ
jgi:ComF family protein